MKTFKSSYIPTVILLLAVLAFVSCESDLEGVVPDSMRTIRLKLQITKADFEHDSSDQERDVRGTTVDWNDGERIYLRFYTDNDIAIGYASYVAAVQQWNMMITGEIASDKQMKVEVTYFKDLPSTIAEEVNIDASTAVYQDLEGTYIQQGNDIFIKANLTPLTSRVRFRGAEGDFLNIGGINHYTSYNRKSGAFTSSNSFIASTVQSNGYTPYIYCVWEDNENRQLKINRGDGNLFTMTGDSTILNVGRSGWMYAPSGSSHSGWTQKTVNGEQARGYYRTYDGERYSTAYWVDLGLPSGNLWCDMNIYADESIASASGDVKDIFGVDYYWVAKDSHVYSPWSVPTEADFQELLQYCTWEWDEDVILVGVNGYTVTGSTGESIFLPVSSSNSEEAYYWTSTSETGAYYILELGSGYHYVHSITYNSQACYVRPIIKP